MNLADDDRLKIIEWAARHADIKEVYLYGSRARGDNRPDSDIDLAIVMHAAKGAESGYGTWFFWQVDYKESPDLQLTHELHLEWYEAGAGLERVGPGVERDGVLIYPSVLSMNV